MVDRRIPALLACAALAACVTERDRRAPAPAPRITDVWPARVTVGMPFGVQPGGDSVVSVEGQNLFRGSILRWNREPLETYGDGTGRSLSALVPARLYALPGSVVLTVEQPGGGQSNPLPVTVMPKTGAAPVVIFVHPEESPAGQLFSPQPGGFAAIAVTGANYLPGATIVFDGANLETVFGDVDRLSALVPPALLARPRVVRILVRNPDGKLSAPARFTLTPGR